MRYNKGDTVIIRSDLEDNVAYGLYVASDDYAWFKPGEPVVIDAVYKNYYSCEHDPYLTHDMIDHEATITFQLDKFDERVFNLGTCVVIEPSGAYLNHPSAEALGCVNYNMKEAPKEGGLYFIRRSTLSNGIRSYIISDLKKKQDYLMCEQAIIIKSKEPLVLGKFEIDDLIVSLARVRRAKEKGDLFKVLKNSSEKKLYFRPGMFSYIPEVWRLATPDEKALWEDGIRNIEDFKKENPVWEDGVKKENPVDPAIGQNKEVLNTIKDSPKTATGWGFTVSVGDVLTITERPNRWSETFGNCGLDDVKYPYSFVVADLEKYFGQISLKEKNGYGWVISRETLKCFKNDFKNSLEIPELEENVISEIDLRKQPVTTPRRESKLIYKPKFTIKF